MWRVHRFLRVGPWPIPTYFTAHFYKWKLGDGKGCMWCALCRRFPVVRRVIPYSYEGVYE